MEKQDFIDRLLRAAPKLNDRELREMNRLFPSYIFRRKRTREVWTSCCGRHETLPEGHPVLEAAHFPLPKPERIYWGCHAGLIDPEAVAEADDLPEEVPCPFCGKQSKVKELGRAGSRKSLWYFRRAVALRWYRGALWVMGYDLQKSYVGDSGMTSLPRYKLVAVYRFAPGSVKYAVRPYWYEGPEWDAYGELKTENLRAKFKLPKPFQWCMEYWDGYDIIGESEVEKSPFRWCGFEDYKRSYSGLMRFLAVCTAYPRQVEMLMKNGLEEIVADFVERKKSNTLIFDWRSATPQKAFGLTMSELREFLATDKHLDILRTYRILKKAGIRASFADMAELKQAAPSGESEKTARVMRDCGLGWTQLKNYLSCRAYPKRKKKPSDRYMRDRVQEWLDYIEAAKLLGYDLKNLVFATPKDLAAHHDRATAAVTAVAEKKRREQEEAAARQYREQERARLRSLSRKYTYSDGRWLIVPPRDAAAIVAEGKALAHCVGGYADRHVRGSTTILFLRDRRRPGKSLVTLEMEGDTIKQIHGYADERKPCKENPKREDPRKLYEDFLDPWLEWVQSGSRRDKKGYPVVPVRRAREAVAV